MLASLCCYLLRRGIATRRSVLKIHIGIVSEKVKVDWLPYRDFLPRGSTVCATVEEEGQGEEC